MTSIVQQFLVRIKARLRQGMAEWGLLILVTAVGVSGFSLGRISALEAPRQLVGVQAAQSASAVRAMPLGGEYVASRTGEVYYYPWCSGALKIPEEKQRWFKTAEEAKRAGYRPAKNCKGMVAE